jgi:hypothetical protein
VDPHTHALRDDDGYCWPPTALVLSCLRAVHTSDEADEHALLRISLVPGPLSVKERLASLLGDSAHGAPSSPGHDPARQFATARIVEGIAHDLARTALSTEHGGDAPGAPQFQPSLHRGFGHGFEAAARVCPAHALWYDALVLCTTTRL